MTNELQEEIVTAGSVKRMLVYINKTYNVLCS